MNDDRSQFEKAFPSRNKWLGDRYDSVIDQARWEAYQAGQVAARAWRPISEAPKDGIWFIARSRYEGQVFRCRWGTAELWASEHGDDPKNYIECGWDDGENEADPIYWIPEPPGPQS